MVLTCFLLSYFTFFCPTAHKQNFREFLINLKLLGSSQPRQLIMTIQVNPFLTSSWPLCRTCYTPYCSILYFTTIFFRNTSYFLSSKLRNNTNIYSWTHITRILKGIQNLFELHEFSNYRSSDYFGQILKKISRGCVFTIWSTVQAKEEHPFEQP